MKKIFGKVGVSVLASLAFSLFMSGCDSGGAAGAPAAQTQGTSPVSTKGAPPDAPPVSRNFSTDVLVFTGAGTWGTEIADVESLLRENGKSFQEVNSAQLDAMSPADIAKFGVIYMPGGSGGTETGSVSSRTAANLRIAVQQLGVSWVGYCAGAWVAVAPAPASGGNVSYGFGVVDGAVLDLWQGPGTNAEYEQTPITFVDGHTENELWYGGPITPNAGVVARYSDGAPAISQIRSGNGLVVIAGTHPALSQSSLDSLGVSPDTSSRPTAWKMFDAALGGPLMETFN